MSSADSPAFSFERARSNASAYLELGKPRVVSMVLVTTCVGYYLGSGEGADILLLVHCLLSTAIAATGTLALNEYMERDLDALMLRTQNRPIPSGRIQPEHALLAGTLATVVGLVYQTLAVGTLPAMLTAATTASYLFLYTPMKRVSPLCTLVGAIPGALPPVVGWATAQGGLGIQAGVLFAILFLWQLPHSLAIARLYRDDYARAGIRLLPVVDPDGPSTGRQVVLNSVALLAVATVPTLIGLAGIAYFICASVMGIIMLGYSVKLAKSRSVEDARGLLLASLVYLPIVLGAMGFDQISPQ